ncbi:MAG: tRNA (adenosine(37)-N6)-dimethylallyltransferase MiaA [Clostridia bacterium]|nr:tRNA (adenosine(37)-N6)-dimethylallyltransferase MiaA [Clostridia bacterium]
MKFLVVCGATASGKTALAVECAKRLNGEIISCDALLVYRGLNIGTAKPSEEDRGGIPHYMIDVAEPTENFSVSDFERLALPIAEDIIARGKTPILCGGTGFYMNALLYSHSYGNVPANAEIRARYERMADELGKDALFERLKEVDSESAQILHPNDTKRVIRALEIYEQTGRKKSEQQDGDVPRYDFTAVAFDYSREELYRRIRIRVEEMFRRRLVDEVKALLESGVPENAQCMQGIGYKEVVECLKNGDSQSTMCDIIEKNTRHYAKRQLTFFKRTKNLSWIVPSENAVQEVISIYESGRAD